MLCFAFFVAKERAKNHILVSCIGSSMKKIGRIRTKSSIIPKVYDVIEVDGKMYAGKDAFLYPQNNYDLRDIACLSFPDEWEWTEKYTEVEGESPFEKDYKGKYFVIRGQEAKEKIEDILKRHETGVLSLFDEQYPYAIPLNHVYENGRLYMHSGKAGKKLGVLRKNPNACYCLYGNAADNVPKNVRSCHLEYESILFFGKIRICTDAKEKENAVLALTNHYGTPYSHGFADMIDILVFEIDRATARTGRFKPGQKRELFFCDFTVQ